ncbi:CHASE domain-containing protein [Fontivita pretiosa]|uniref:CHASE domain-containing protein n=1 Tax=Fontivita pretiosa TaxID=2989684 RepID=UPI003D17D5F7
MVVRCIRWRFLAGGASGALADGQLRMMIPQSTPQPCAADSAPAAVSRWYRSAFRGRAWPPYVVLLVGLLTTAAIGAYVWRTNHATRQLRFESAVAEACDNIHTRLDLYIGALRGGAGLFAASNGQVSRQQFRDYCRRIDLYNRYPGIQGVGFSLRVPAGQNRRVEAEAAQQVPGFRIWPDEPQRDEYHTILYLEPQDARNRHALGYDMFSEPVRRAAMQRARDNATAAASAKVRLVQEIYAGDVQAGFLIYVPVYQSQQVPDSVQKRREALLGFVYAPFRADDLLRGIFAHETPSVLDLEVYDGPVVAAAHVMHRSAPATLQAGTSASDYVPTLRATRTIGIAGQVWTIAFSSNAHFDAQVGRNLTAYTVVAGVLVSGALFWLQRSQSMAQRRAETTAAELRLSEQALRVSESRFRRLADANMIGIVFARSDGTVTYANQAHCQIIGRSPDDVRAGRVRWDQITAPEYRHLDLQVIQELRARSVCAPYENEYIRPDGTRVPVLIGVALLEGSQDEHVAFTIDLTQRKRQERELRMAKEAAEAANRAKDQFLAVLSHELRTPLTPVLALAAAGSADAALPPEIRADFAVIRRNVELEARLIDDLLDLTKIGRGKLRLEIETVDLHSVVTAAVAVCCAEEATNKRLLVELELQAERHHVRGDAARLQQILWNLLKNAVKFTPAGGRITVRTRNQPPQQTGQLDDRIVVEVIDTGIGIEADVLPRIFDAFEQGESPTRRQFGGLGLGLAITRGLVEAHGATIEVQSAGAGQGATFAVTLATVPAPWPQTPPPELADVIEPVAAAPTPRATLLLVEDHADTARALGRLLGEAGYQVHTAASVAQAIERAASVRFDVLLSDLGLPDGSGIDLLKRLLAERGGEGAFAAIALTGFGMDDDVARTAAAGFAEHLTKPVDFQKLQEAIERVVRRRDNNPQAC